MRLITKPVRGQGMVEFALTVPVALFLFISFIQLGLILSSYVSVTNIAREGARAAVVSGLTDAQRRAAAQNAVFPDGNCTSLVTGFAHSTGSINCTNGVEVVLPLADPVHHPNRREQVVTVKVTWNISMDILYVGALATPVVATSSMRIE